MHSPVPVTLELPQLAADVATFEWTNPAIIGTGHPYIAADMCPLLPQVPGLTGRDGTLPDALGHGGVAVWTNRLCHYFGSGK